VKQGDPIAMSRKSSYVGTERATNAALDVNQKLKHS